MDLDQFVTIARHVRVEIPKIKGSRFIADAFPADTDTEAKRRLGRVAEEFHDASHHCFALSVESGRIERSSDAGEPGGTAGPPILRQIRSSGATNLIVVVTRYYGGTNLGKGGLIRAYGAAAKAVLNECKRITKTVEARIRLRFDYPDTSAAMRTVESFDGRIESSDFGVDTCLTVTIPASRVAEFEEVFQEALGGRGEASSA